MPSIVKQTYIALKKIATSPLEKLQEKHKKILEQAFQLSKSDRSASDKLYAEAAEIEKEISRHS